MKKLFALLALCTMAFTAQAQDDLTWWGNYTTEPVTVTGNNKVPGNYEAAMFVAGDGTLKGISIEQIRIQTRLSASSSENVKFWIRTQLDGENVVEVTPESVAGSGFTTVTLPEAYALPETGAYVGYSFRVTQWWNEYEGTPVVYANKSVEKGFYLKQPGETEFTDKSSTGCLAAQIGFKAPEMKMWWGNYTGSEQIGLLGNNKVPGNYAAAMFVAGDDTFKGASITGIRIQTRLSSSSAENVTFWLRTELDGENVVEVTPETLASSGYTTIALPEAYKLPETGVYVGYSFRVTKWWNEYEGTPIVYAKKSVEKGLYLQQPDETTLSDKSSTGCLAAQVEISGAAISTDGAQVADDIDDMVAVVGQPISVDLTITNQGTAGVSDLEFTYTLDGQTQQGNVTLAEPIDAIIGMKKTVSVQLGAPQTSGSQDVQIEITKVNGKANAVTGKKAKCSFGLTVLSESAPRKAVAEVFYNAGTGYAPRAFVGAEKLNQQENVIAFLIDHYSGAQAVDAYADFQKLPNGTSYTNRYSSYPIAEVNRMFTIDPYTGTTTPSNYSANHFEAAEPVKATLDEPTEATVTLTAEWANEAKDSVDLSATANFMANFKTAPYRLAFVIIEDGVKETISNYIRYYTAAYPDEDMASWIEAPYTNPDYALNNVAVAATDVNGIQKSLPTKNIVAGEDYTYDCGLKIEQKEGREDATNARAIVLLINKDTKRIVNADIIPVVNKGETVGITSTNNEKAAVNSQMFDLQGRRVLSASKPGLYIIDGRKVIMK